MYIIDRFEGDYAVCENQENGGMINILKKNLPYNAHEGDCIDLIDGNYVINYKKTDELKKKAEELAKDMWK